MTPERRYRALLIGNSLYRADEAMLPRLEGPPNDVSALRAALTHVDYGLFDAEDVIVRGERTSHELAGEMEGFFREADRNDVLLLYFSGHGQLDEYGNLRLCASNTKVERLISTTISWDQVNDMMEGSAAGSIVIVLDCCHSGAFKSSSDIATSMTPPVGRGRYIMAACRARALARDAFGPSRLSVFTRHLVEGLTGKIVKTTEPGFVSLGDLYHYVDREMRITTAQTPTLNARSEGTLCIAKSTVRRKPLSLSPRTIPLVDVEPGESLPVERVRVCGLLPGDFWSATTQTPWVQITRMEEQLELRLSPPPGKSRANVEVVNHDTGELQVVRIVVRAGTTPVMSKAVGSAAVGAAAHAAPADRPDPILRGAGQRAELLLEALMKRVPEVRQALVASADGLPSAAHGPLGRNDLERLAAGTCGVGHGANAAARLAGGGWHDILLELDAGNVGIARVERAGAWLALYATDAVDLGQLSYEMLMTADALDGTVGSSPADRAHYATKGSDRSRFEWGWIFDDLMRRVPGSTGCLSVSVDGIALTASSDFPHDKQGMAAALSSLFGSARAISTLLSAGRVRTVLVQMPTGCIMLTPFGAASVLGQFLAPDADLGMSRYEATVLADRVGQIYSL